jgi:mRNA deadenylase 3'-5' endonuclease subunit Ccr4
VYLYEKNIDSGHKIFNDNTKRFLLNSGEDVDQCLIKLRTQESVSEEILNAVDALMASNGRRRHKWTEDEDRIILEKHLSSGNKWSDLLIPGCTGNQIKNHWTNLRKQVAVYLYKKNIDSGHKIFNDNTKRFLLNRGEDVDQCLIILRTQESVSEEILNAVKVLMSSNAKKRPPSSELGNATKKKKVATKKKKVATKNQTAKKKTVPKNRST